MSIQIDSIPLNGLRKAHLYQLASYIDDRDMEGWYYGNREQFESRHADLLELAKWLREIAADRGCVLPRKR
jgi:hypothetical protein